MVTSLGVNSSTKLGSRLRATIATALPRRIGGGSRAAGRRRRFLPLEYRLRAEVQVVTIVDVSYTPSARRATAAKAGRVGIASLVPFKCGRDCHSAADGGPSCQLPSRVTSR